MSNRVIIFKTKALARNIIPELIYIAIVVTVFIKINWIVGLILIPVICISLFESIKNLLSIKKVSKRLANLDTVLYNPLDIVILTNTSIISTERSIFTVDYEDIDYIYEKQGIYKFQYVEYMKIVTKDKKKYKLAFFKLNIEDRHKEMKEITRIIKSLNKDIKVDPRLEKE